MINFNLKAVLFLIKINYQNKKSKSIAYDVLSSVFEINKFAVFSVPKNQMYIADLFIFFI